MAKKAIVGVKVKEERKELSCKALGLEYRSKMKKIIEVLGNPECEAALDQNCGSTATKFRPGSSDFSAFSMASSAAGISPRCAWI